jgi:hypothetical protein
MPKELERADCEEAACVGAILTDNGAILADIKAGMHAALAGLDLELPIAEHLNGWGCGATDALANITAKCK